mgnify:CR=1 FL=1
MSRATRSRRPGCRPAISAGVSPASSQPSRSTQAAGLWPCGTPPPTRLSKAPGSVALSKARWAVMALLGLALVLGMGLGTLITRQLQRQLGGEPRTAVAVARAVAQGRFYEDQRQLLSQYCRSKQAQQRQQINQ